MSMLTDTSIQQILTDDFDGWSANDGIRNEKLLISNFDEGSLTPVGYDLRVGRKFLKMYRKVTQSEDLKDDENIEICPGEIVAIKTEEYVGMPQNRMYSGILVSKVSLVEMGLSHISTSLDADWKGEMIITITNHSDRKIALTYKQPFCTMILFKNKDPATKQCGKYPEKHLMNLIDEWKPFKRKPLLLLWIMKLLIPSILLIWLLIRVLRQQVVAGEVPLYIAISSFLFVVFDKLFKTE